MESAEASIDANLSGTTQKTLRLMETRGFYILGGFPYDALSEVQQRLLHAAGDRS